MSVKIFSKTTNQGACINKPTDLSDIHMTFFQSSLNLHIFCIFFAFGDNDNGSSQMNQRLGALCLLIKGSALDPLLILEKA